MKIDLTIVVIYIYIYFFNVIVYYYSSYSLSLHCLGRTGVPYPPLCVSSGVWSPFFSGYAVLWGACGLVWEEGGRGGGGRGMVCLCMGGSLFLPEQG